MSAAITLSNVHVRFPVIGADARSLKKAALSGVLNVASSRRQVGGEFSTQTRTTTVEALNGIDLKIEQGARVGLIGHNGAGKTTLLRVIAGIYPPNEGSVHRLGRVTSLLDIGLGIDINATGRENVFLRALYMGRSKRETKEAIDDVAEFAGLGPFLDMPMRTYSAGMQARLLFAVATAFRAEILLLDEGVGAGDAAFAERARQRMRDFVEQAGILVFASHDTALLRSFCRDVVKMEAGRIVETGPAGRLLA